MRLASVVHGQDTVWGIVGDEEFIVLDERWPDLQSALTETPAAIVTAGAKSRRRFALDTVARWLPPVIQPKKIFCVGMNYRAHAKEAGGKTASAHPSIFPRFIDSFVGHGQPTVKPRNSETLDYEAELAVVIGMGGRHIPEESAKRHIGGYTCLSENSVRDFQKHNPQVTPGKNFESSGAIGPWVTTADAVADVAALRVVGRLNGEVVQSALVEELIFPIAAIIAYISSFTPLSPGDIIATGTPDGVGFLRTPPVFLKRGDVFETEIAGVGTLSNPVEDEAAQHAQRPQLAQQALAGAFR
jgi:2-keto-4-pentenoate hydratase/2-oxohepta-3-ene-1,7-dioic acid hydratase in catechol pathway